MKTLDETINFAKKNSEKSGYNDLDIAQMESIKKEFKKNGQTSNGGRFRRIRGRGICFTEYLLV
jgi:hypothetical protein